MAKRLRGLEIAEVSIVHGDGNRPANQQATALVYKAAKGEEDMHLRKSEPTTGNAAPPAKVSLAEKIGTSIVNLLERKKTAAPAPVEKVAQTRVSTSEHQSTSVYKETWDDGDGNAAAVAVTDNPDGTTTITVKSGEAAAVEKKVAAAHAATDYVAVIKSAITEAVKPLDDRLAKLEGASVGSQQVAKSIITVKDNGEVKYPHFHKSLLEQLGLTPGQRLTKAAITSANFTHGLALDEAEKFIDHVMDESRALKMARRVKMTAATRNIDKIGLGQKVLRKPTVGTQQGDTTTINTGRVTLTSKDVMAVVNIGDNSIEDNIEGSALVDHIMRMVGQAASNELEEAAFHGDTAVADANGILDIQDGWYKLLKTGGATVIEAMADANRLWPGAAPVGAKATRMLKALATKYRIDPTKLALMMHPDLYLDFGDEIAKLGYGEAFASVTGLRDLPLRSIPQIPCPLIRTNMSFTYSATPYTDGTFVLLTNPQNLIIGVQREIRVETERRPREQATYYVVSMRYAVNVENAAAAVLYDHAKAA